MINTHTPLSRKALALAAIAALMLGALLPILTSTNIAHAAQITDRSLTLQAGASDGGSMPGGDVNHLFEFTVPSGADIGSIRFEYCTTAADTGGSSCVTPTGLDTTSATLGSEVGSDIAGFTIVNATNGAPYLTRTASSVSASDTAILRLDNISNPTDTNETFFVRISTYVSEDTTGAATDTGSVAASTAQQIILDGTMPESLVFCTGETIGLTGGVPDCATATAGAVSFDRLFSPTDTAIATSQMAASTNAGFGYSITVNGPTMTSGANTISTMSTSTTGVRGTSQFGLNLKANTVSTSTPAVGTEAAPVANGTNYKGQAATDYDTVDDFKFATGDSVANSANGGAGGTDAQIHTVSYIVNVPGSQPAGTYTSTLTYICTATF